MKKLLMAVFTLLLFFETALAQHNKNITNKIANETKIIPTQEYSIMELCEDCCLDDDCGGGGGGQKPNPPLISSTKNYVCSDQDNLARNNMSVTLTASSCVPSGITWFIAGTSTTVAINTLSLTVSPSATTSYNATCSNANGRSLRSNSIQINFEFKPSVIPNYLITPSKSKYYVFEQVVASSPSGCPSGTNLTWFNSYQTGSLPIKISYSFAGTPYVSCKGQFCFGNANNLTLPIFDFVLSKIPDTTCSSIGSSSVGSTTLNIRNCIVNKEWRNVNSPLILGTIDSLIVSPDISTTYNLKCIDPTGGYFSPNFIVSVIQAPTISKTITTNSFGSFYRLTASCSNSTSLRWDNGSTNASRNVSTTQAGTYYVQCGSTHLSRTTSISLLDPPIIVASKAIACKGQTIIFNASGCDRGLTWYGNVNNGTYINGGSSNPLTYTVPNTTVINSISLYATCSGSNVITTTSNLITIPINSGTIPANPSIVSTPNPANILAGQSVTLVASVCTGSNTILWNTEETSQTIVVSPIQSADYYAYCVNQSCPSNGTIASVNVFELDIPSISTIVDSTCNADSLNLIATGCNSIVKWYTLALNSTISNSPILLGTGNPIKILPLVTQYYTAKCESQGVLSSFSVYKKVTLISPPIISINGNLDHIFAGESITLTATCDGTRMLWNNNTTNSELIVNPFTTSTYSAKCISNTCQSTVNSKTIQVCPLAQNFISPTNNFSLSTTVPTSKIIAASNLISGSNTRINYRAEQGILLYPGFAVATGSIFKTEIGGCQ